MNELRRAKLSELFLSNIITKLPKMLFGRISKLYIATCRADTLCAVHSSSSVFGPCLHSGEGRLLLFRRSELSTSSFLAPARDLIPAARLRACILSFLSEAADRNRKQRSLTLTARFTRLLELPPYGKSLSPNSAAGNPLVRLKSTKL